MSKWNIIWREIFYNKTHFAIGLLCISVALGLVMGAVTLLAAHEIKTEQIINQKEHETRADMAKLEDDYRLMMRDMGYNVLILHEDQSIDSLRIDGSPNTYMPLEYVFALSTGGIKNLNHLFPVLQKRTTWEEKEQEIILCGIMGQVPNFEKPQFLDDEGRYRNPIRETLPQGTIEAGYDIARITGINAGDQITFQGEEFTVHRVHSRRGNDDDITLWCDLEKVQQWFGLEGKINGILALECVCNFEAFGMVESEVQQILPDIQVMEFGTILRARFEARARAAEMRETAIDSEIAYRAHLGVQRQQLVRFLIPVVLTGAAIWIFFLISSNVKERRGEIAIMRTVGVRESTIMSIFLIKAALMGGLGAVLGSIPGLLAGASWEGIALWSTEFVQLIHPVMLLLVILGTPLLAVVAGWIPARKAAQLDPAVILREE